ncbi:MAG: tetratricopeptide repeat protein [Proteobacteria bacterium]|nr:tetratricopeptide repeat protein [Pseudomonadota bacterium]
MDAYTTEEEQIAKVKNWWNENGKAIVLGLVLGLGGLFGYRYWESTRIAEGQNASINYEHLLSVASNGASDEATAAGQAIIAGYPKSTYARLSALVLAKLAVDVRDLPEAKSRLQWVIDNSKDGKIKPMAQARMAQVLLAEGNVEAASSIVAEIDPAHADLFTELRGDVLLATGKIEEARKMYEQTLDGALKRSNSGAIVQLKIDNLNVAAQ